jgi:hypothetical protein
MTPQEKKFWQTVHNRSGTLSAELLRAFFLTFAALRDAMGEDALARAIALGGAERVYEQVLQEAVRMAAYQVIRDRLRAGIIDGVKYYGRTVPVPPVFGTLRIGFDVLSPTMIEAVRTLETRVITRLETDTRATFVQVVERGIRDGVSPKATARLVRSTLGLAPNQETAIANFEKALRGTNPNASPTDYALRDRRFDKLLAKGELSEAQIDKMVSVYRKRMIAHSAEVQTRTAALDAQRLAQRLSWEDAISKGIIDRDRLMKQRVGVADERERPEHVAINDQVRHFDAPYSNGEVVSGDLSWQCRCLDRYFVQRAA